MFLRKIATVVALTTLASSAWAGCGASDGRVSIVGNEFPAIQTVGAGAMECAGGGVTVEKNLTADHQKKSMCQVCKVIQLNLQQRLLQTRRLLH